MSKSFSLIENYLYMYHTDTYVILPTYPQQITDTLNSTFNSSNAIARSAPIFSYSNSGPRTVQVSLSLHRDMMEDLNYGNSNVPVEIGDDYVDTIIKQLQAIALPNYAVGNKMVNPPMVAIRFGNEIFIKGVVNGGITVTYNMPLLDNGKYAQATIGFTVYEVDPYDAKTVMQQGSLRGMDSASLKI